MEKQPKDWAKTEYEYDKREKKKRLVRNQFPTVGSFGMPRIKRQAVDLEKIELWNYTKAKEHDGENRHRTIHFFTQDWHYESVYEKPEEALQKLEQYYALLTPDFSLYADMPMALQIYSTFKSRWCGAFWQRHGLRVVPTISWSTPDSFAFCFDGVEKGSVVAVSTYCAEGYKREFMSGYDAMFEKLKPSAVICYGQPFPEMRGTIAAIDPYDTKQLIKKLGIDEFLRKVREGELYPAV